MAHEYLKHVRFTALKYALDVTQNPVDKRAAAKAAYIAMKFFFWATNSLFYESDVTIRAKVRLVLERVKALDRRVYRRLYDAFIDWLVFHRFEPTGTVDEVMRKLLEYAARLTQAYYMHVKAGRTEFINSVKVLVRLLRRMVYPRVVTLEEVESGVYPQDMLGRPKPWFVKSVERLYVWVRRILEAVRHGSDVDKLRAHGLYVEAAAASNEWLVNFEIDEELKRELQRARRDYIREYMREYRRNGPRRKRGNYTVKYRR